MHQGQAGTLLLILGRWTWICFIGPTKCLSFWQTAKTHRPASQSSFVSQNPFGSKFIPSLRSLGSSAGSETMRELVTLQVGSFANFVGSHFWNFQVHTQTQALLTHPLTHSAIQLPSLINIFIHIFLKDELNGLAEDPYADPVFKNQSLNMDVLYRSGETHQVCRFFVFICFTLNSNVLLHLLLLRDLHT